MNWNNKELKIGAFVVLVLLAAFLTINWLRSQDIFNRNYDIVTGYEDVQGLLPSASVMFKGFKVGQVSEVNYDPSSGLFEVICSISKNYPIPEDSRMTIVGLDIMGTKGIRIDPGISSAHASDGAVLEGSSEPDMIAALAGSVSSLAGKLENTLDSLDLVVSNVNSLLGEKNREAVAGILTNLERTAENVESVSAALGGKSQEFAHFAVNLNSLSSKLDSILTEAGSAVSDVSEITAAINPEEISSMVESFRTLLDKVQDPDGSLGKLISDDSVYESLDSLLADVDDLVNKIKDNPKKYIKISVF